MGDVMSNEEFRRRGAALDEVLDRHLGSGSQEVVVQRKFWPGDPPQTNWFVPTDGPRIVANIFDWADYSLGAMNPAAERKRLLKIQQLARELSKTLRELHPHTFDRIQTQSRDLHDLGAPHGIDPPFEGDDLENFWHHFWFTARSFGELMNKITPTVSGSIDRAPVAGRRNLTNVMAVEDLRDVWESRKNAPAPMNITDAGPFAEFIAEAFAALGIESNPRAAMDSWREYRAKYPIKN
jgi:hypothetical protein